MKILFVCFFVPYPPTAGHLQRDYNLIRQIAKENEIYLVTFNQRVLLPDQQKVSESIEALKPYCKYIKVFDIPSDYSALKWYSTLLFNVFSSAPFTAWKFHSQAMGDEIKQLIAKNDFDLVHVDTVDIAAYSEMTGELPKVLNHHNVESILVHRRAGNTQQSPGQAVFAFAILQAAQVRKEISETFRCQRVRFGY